MLGNIRIFGNKMSIKFNFSTATWIDFEKILVILPMNKVSISTETQRQWRKNNKEDKK